MVAVTGRRLAGALLLCWAGMASAQAIGPLDYRSVFESYRGHTAENVQPWRDSNDQVGRIGGWRSYAREAQQAASAAPATPQGAPVGQGMQQGASPHGSMNHESMNHGAMKHGSMNHDSKNHGSMNHGSMNHGSMNHGAMHPDTAPGKKP